MNNDERAAFEAWGRAEGLEDKAIGRGMDYPLGKHLWRAWQAGRAALAAQRVPADLQKTACPYCESEWVTGEQHDANLRALAAAPQAPAVPEQFNHVTQLQIAYIKGLGDGANAKPAPQAPLTRDRVKLLLTEAGYADATAQERADFINGVRHAEKVHGIAACVKEPGNARVQPGTQAQPE